MPLIQSNFQCLDKQRQNFPKGFWWHLQNMTWKKKTDSETRKFTLGPVCPKPAVSNLRISLLSVSIKELDHAKMSLSVYEAIRAPKSYIQQIIHSLEIMYVFTAIISLKFGFAFLNAFYCL